MAHVSRIAAVVGFSFLLWAGGSPEAPAQNLDRVGPRAYGVTYRPASVSYRVVESEHFDLVYQAGARAMARRTTRALESTLPGTDSLVGRVDDLHMPVVINKFNDRSNGFVHAFPFRQEIETPSIKSDALVARASSWPALVAPHELVHAAHAEVDGGVGIGGLIRPFAPDMARELNLLAPRGLVEGVAVYRESRIDPPAGRLNSPLFQMKMEAAMLSDDPWSLTQMLERPAYTQPFNRFYIGGAHAFEYLAERGDSVSTDFFQTATTWHNRLPMFGHGVWLGLSTGQFPFQLGNEIQTALREEYRAEMEDRKPFSWPTVVAGEEGVNHRRPYWLSDTTLVAYVHGYDVRPGFYRVDGETGERTSIRIQSLTEDRNYTLGRDTTYLLAGRYVQDPFVLRQGIAEVERINLSDGDVRRLTDDGRAFAPAPGADGSVYAIVNDGPFTRWAQVGADGSPEPLTPEAPRSIRQIAPSPDDSTIAVLMNENGRQHIYRARPPDGSSLPLRPWIGLDETVIYDLSWGPKGRYLLFAADWNGTPNVFAYDTETNDVRQFTNVRFGALEPSLSPDRSTLAFVNYRHERYDLVRMPFRPDSAEVVPDSVVQRRWGEDNEHPSPAPQDSVSLWETEPRPYQAWRHLRPRMVYPILHGNGDQDPLPYLEQPAAGPLGMGVGLGVQGTDPLQRWVYQGTAYWQNGRLWGEARLQRAALLRPSLSAYNRPFTTIVGETLTPSGRDSFLSTIEERGINVGLDLPISLTSNVYRSYIRLGADTELRQTRRVDERLPEPTAFTNRVTVNPSALVGYRIQQNPRDLVPNTGLLLGAQGEFDLWTNGPPSGRGLVTSLDTYVPILRKSHTGIRLGGRLLVQNRSSIFNTGAFVPRGHENVTRLPSGPFLQLETEVTQPFWYIDDGLTILPVYAKALSLYGFGEVLGTVQGAEWSRALSSVGVGLSLKVRVFYGFSLDLRIGQAYLPHTDEVVTIYR